MGQVLTKKAMIVLMPYHSLFELSCTLKREKKANPTNYRIYDGFSESSPFHTQPLPIDEKFFAEYFDPSLPYVKAGDYIFLCAAKKANALLISEDCGLLKAAKACGVDSMTSEEFLTMYE